MRARRCARRGPTGRNGARRHHRARLTPIRRSATTRARAGRSSTPPAPGSSGYPDRPAPAGSQLVPEVARSLPTLSADRRTYTFTIRPGFRFSPPSNEPVTAATFKHSIERSLDPRMNGPAPRDWSDIVGVKAFRAGKTRHVAGIRAHGDTLSIRLTRRLRELPLPARDALLLRRPDSTRPSTRRDCRRSLRRPLLRRLLPAGPAARPQAQPELPRPPTAPARRDRFRAERRRGAGHQRRRSGKGRLRRPVGHPAASTARLAARYGPASPLGRAGKQQYFVHPFLAYSITSR